MKLTAHQLAFSYTPGVSILRSVSLTLSTGQVAFILGANGTGKTTLLDCLFGLRRPSRGSVLVDGRDLQQLAPRERARHIGLVPQWHEPVFEFSVKQAVLMGRAPHLGPFSRPGRDDLRAVESAIDAVGIRPLSDRPYTKISGGERQLTLIARGLAQGARCLLMDEPAAHLDPHHQHEVLHIVRQLAEEGFAFAITSHLPNHALLYGDWAIFLIDGKAELEGPPRTVINEDSLRAAYNMEFEIVEGASGARAVLPRVERVDR
jgi:iron complex transport system ATP-binding protein